MVLDVLLIPEAPRARTSNLYHCSDVLCNKTPGLQVKATEQWESGGGCLSLELPHWKSEGLSHGWGTYDSSDVA